ncbi:unnamed protein product, partial [marine sediment metagenome]
LYASTSGQYIIGIAGWNVGDMRLDSVDIIVDGMDAACIWLERIHDDCYIDRCDVTNNSTTYTRRDYFNNGGITVAQDYGSVDTAHAIITNSKVLKTPHHAIAGSGAGFSTKIEYCSLWV